MPPGMSDNYTDDFFLADLVHKNTAVELNYSTMVRHTVEVVHLINAITVSLLSFNHLLTREEEE